MLFLVNERGVMHAWMDDDACVEWLRRTHGRMTKAAQDSAIEAIKNQETLAIILQSA